MKWDRKNDILEFLKLYTKSKEKLVRKEKMFKNVIQVLKEVQSE